MGWHEIDFRSSEMDCSTTCSSRDYDSSSAEKTPVYIEESKCKSLQGSRQNTPFNLSSADSNSQFRRAMGSAIEMLKADESKSWTALDGSIDLGYSPLRLGSAIPTPVDLGFIPITADPTPMMGLGYYSLPDDSRLAQALKSLNLGSPDAAGEEDKKTIPDYLASLRLGLPMEDEAPSLPDAPGLPQCSPSWSGVGYMPRAESPIKKMQDLYGQPYSASVSGVVDPPRLLSIGSRGHPTSCGPACKYAWKTRGCKEGLDCSHCHLCLWTRASMRNSRQYR